jgi:hypothetical protein
VAADEAIEEQAAVVRASGALGRSAGLNRLFDYLVDASGSEVRPKEVEIALAVFSRDSGFDGAQDASVRVAMHRLRRKLEDFYAGPGRDQPLRLSIPKGEYRIVAELQGPAPLPPKPPRRWPWVVAAVAVVVALHAGVWAFLAGRGGELGEVRRSAPWAELARSKRPLILVVGDYYIFGETDPRTGVSRLVREYGINSHEDLDAWITENPEDVGRFRDLDLYYLPVGAAFALKDVSPVVAGEDVRVVMASDLTSDMIRRNDIVYVGYFSGLGALRDPVFGASRLAVGDTWDELVDTRSGTTYASQEGGPGGGADTKRDYGYVSSFPGPQGNRIVVIAGARDMGLMQAAEAVTGADTLKALLRQAKDAPAFEALYEAEGIRRANLGGRLLLAAPLDPNRIWSGARRELRFPAG